MTLLYWELIVVLSILTFLVFLFSSVLKPVEKEKPNKEFISTQLMFYLQAANDLQKQNCFLNYLSYFFSCTFPSFQNSGKVNGCYISNLLMTVCKYMILLKIQIISIASGHNRRHFPKIQRWSFIVNISFCFFLWIISSILCPLITLLLSSPILTRFLQFATLKLYWIFNNGK